MDLPVKKPRRLEVTQVATEWYIMSIPGPTIFEQPCHKNLKVVTIDFTFKFSHRSPVSTTDHLTLNQAY